VALSLSELRPQRRADSGLLHTSCIPLNICIGTEMLRWRTTSRSHCSSRAWTPGRAIAMIPVVFETHENLEYNHRAFHPLPSGGIRKTLSAALLENPINTTIGLSLIWHTENS